MVDSVAFVIAPSILTDCSPRLHGDKTLFMLLASAALTVSHFLILQWPRINSVALP